MARARGLAAAGARSMSAVPATKGRQSSRATKVRSIPSAHAPNLEAKSVALPAVGAEVLSDSRRDEYLREVRDELLGSIPSGGGFATYVSGETRRPDEFRQSVDEFIKRATQGATNGW